MDRPDKTSVDGFGTYKDVLNHWMAIKPLIPKGTAQRVETRLNFKFIKPWGERTSVASGCDWSISGVNTFLEKCTLLRKKLDECKRTDITASEWEQWFNENIVGNKKTAVDDRLTYRQIFQIIEDEYYQGKHKFTREKRSRDSVSCQSSFKETYLYFFEKFDKWDEHPNWENVKTYWEQFPDNTRKYEALGKIKKIISYCPNSVKKEVLTKIEKFKIEKSKPQNTKAIDWEQFFNWYKNQKELITQMPEKQALIREGWLWIFKMCVVYGLRPNEIMSAINLYKSISDKEVKTLWGEKGKQYGDSSNINPAFNDKKNNPKMLLILGNGFTVVDTSGNKHFITNKTGGRFCYPLCRNKEIMDYLDVQSIPSKLPEYTPNSDSKPESITRGFPHQLRDKLEDWNCPTTQGYSFRHLGKMLGKLSGLPSGLIADNMGHTESASEQFYNRKTIGLANQLASQVSSYPLPLDIAIGELKSQGFNTDDGEIQKLIKIIYQLDD